MKGVGIAGAGVAFTGSATAETTVSGALDLVDDLVQEALLVVEGDRVLDSLASLGVDYYQFEVLPLVYVEATGATLD